MGSVPACWPANAAQAQTLQPPWFKPLGVDGSASPVPAGVPGHTAPTLPNLAQRQSVQVRLYFSQVDWNKYSEHLR